MTTTCDVVSGVSAWLAHYNGWLWLWPMAGSRNLWRNNLISVMAALLCGGGNGGGWHRGQLMWRMA